VEWHGHPISTSIYKTPVSGPSRLNGVNVHGDDQADRTVHGGPDKAVYAYASEDEKWWADELHREIPPGMFGENLTTSGIDVTNAVIGEIWRIGDTILEVSQPRVPCYKLGIVLGNDDFPRRFGLEVRPGAYLRILDEGTINPGDEIVVVSRPDHGVTVGDVARAHVTHDPSGIDWRSVEALPGHWHHWAASMSR
jgi:MOSC domain-containing protein YiiM